MKKSLSFRTKRKKDLYRILSSSILSTLDNLESSLFSFLFWLSNLRVGEKRSSSVFDADCCQENEDEWVNSWVNECSERHEILLTSNFYCSSVMCCFLFRNGTIEALDFFSFFLKHLIHPRRPRVCIVYMYRSSSRGEFNFYFIETNILAKRKRKTDKRLFTIFLCLTWISEQL